MTKLVVKAFSVSLDGFGAGPEQSVDHPMGKGGHALHTWALGTPTFQKMMAGFAGDLFAGHDPKAGVDDAYAAKSFANLGAWIMGRNMFTANRGPWPDDGWRGWWGEEPPYRCPVFVLTHHARAPLQVGHTTFHFVTDGIESAWKQAKAAAGGKDVRVGGGASTVRAYLQAKLVDEMHVAVSPVLLGRGEPLYRDLDLPALGYRVSEHAGTPAATHIVLTRA